MWYKTYACCMYDKISVSIYVGNIIYEHLFTYDLCINTEFGQGNPVLNPLVNTYIFFIYSILIHTSWRPEIDPQRLHFIFPYFSFFLICLSWDRGVVGLIPHTLISLFFFLLTFLKWPWGYGIESPQPHFIFLFNSLNRPTGRRFDSNTPQPLFFVNSFKCDQEVVVSNATPLNYIFIDSFSSQGHDSNPLTTFS